MRRKLSALGVAAVLGALIWGNRIESGAKTIYHRTIGRAVAVLQRGK